MKTYLLIFWNSIRGFRSYQFLFRNPLKVTLIYWFLFCLALAAAVVSIRYVQLKKMLPSFAAEVARNLPEFSFRKGETSTTLETPVIMNTGSVPIVLDPGDKITRPPPGFTNGMFHIGKTRIKVWMDSDGDPKIIPIKTFPDGKVDRDYILQLGQRLGYILAPFLFVVLTLVFFVVGLLQALFFATLVSFLEKAIQPSFTFDEMLNISVYALTPGSIIIAVYWAWGVAAIPLDLVYFFVYIVFHVMGSGASRRSMMPPAADEH